MGLVNSTNASSVQDIPDPVKEDYKNKYGASLDVSTIAEELKRFFKLVIKYSEWNVPMMSKDVDNLWQCFILRTKLYREYCHKVNNGQLIDRFPYLGPGGFTEDEKTKFHTEYCVTFGRFPNLVIWNLWPKN